MADPNEGWEQLVHGLREECQDLSDRLDALEADRDRLRELGDRMASAIKDRWTGPNGCDCAVCHAALEWRAART